MQRCALPDGAVRCAQTSRNHILGRLYFPETPFREDCIFPKPIPGKLDLPETISWEDYAVPGRLYLPETLLWEDSAFPKPHFGKVVPSRNPNLEQTIPDATIVESPAGGDLSPHVPRPAGVRTAWGLKETYSAALVYTCVM